MASWKIVAITMLSVGALALAAALVVIYSGVIDVGAVAPHYALTEWS
ncbi:hypothetical protein GMSM_07900 [Geomonas sp. Red276]